MFTTAQRDLARSRVLDMARNDPRVTSGALTGSAASGGGDEWSDIDLFFGIIDDVALEDVLRDWTATIEHEMGLLAHFDLPAPPSIYRVFLLPNGLEIDVGITPQRGFRARGIQLHTLFGTPQTPEPAPPPNASYLIGYAWHHILHARSSIEHGDPWRAEYWISNIRDNMLAFACVRLGKNAVHGRGLGQLPVEVTAPFEATLIRSLEDAELFRALAAATTCFLTEREFQDADLCGRLAPVLHEFGHSELMAPSSQESTRPDR